MRRLLPSLLALAALSCSHDSNEPPPAKYVVLVPAGYGSGTRYPVFFALHGAGSYKEDMMATWRSPGLLGSYVVAYVESSEKAPGGGFTWSQNIAQARDQIRACYWNLCMGYSIDTTRVVVGGFSAGGAMAIDLFLTRTVPAKAFICGCPGKPLSFSREAAEAAARREGRGVIIAGEDDFFREDQLEMLGVFEEEGLPCEYMVVPGVGHEFPPDFPDLLDTALDSLGWSTG